MLYKRRLRVCKTHLVTPLEEFLVHFIESRLLNIYDNSLSNERPRNFPLVADDLLHSDAVFNNFTISLYTRAGFECVSTCYNLFIIYLIFTSLVAYLRDLFLFFVYTKISNFFLLLRIFYLNSHFSQMWLFQF